MLFIKLVKMMILIL